MSLSKAEAVVLEEAYRYKQSIRDLKEQPDKRMEVIEAELALLKAAQSLRPPMKTK